MSSKPLTNMLKKGVHFRWTSLAQNAFELLKQALVQAPVLAIPNFNKQFIVEIGASELGIGAVVMQDCHPISYLSQTLCDKNKGSPLIKKDAWQSY